MLQDRRQAERSAALDIQQTSENRRRVKIGKAKKIDRGIYTDQGHRLQIADNTIVLDRFVFAGHGDFLYQFARLVPHLRSAFSVWRSAFGVQRSAFSVGRLSSPGCISFNE